MIIQINRCEQPMDRPMHIIEFANFYHLTIVVHERAHVRPGGVGRYYAKLDTAEVIDERMLSGAFGNGTSPMEAIEAYAREINGKKIVVNAHSEDRQELWAHLLI